MKLDKFHYHEALHTTHVIQILVFTDNDEVAIDPQTYTLEFSGPLEIPE